MSGREKGIGEIVNVGNLAGNAHRKIRGKRKAAEGADATFPRKGTLPLSLEIDSEGRDGVVADDDRFITHHRCCYQGINW